MSYKIYEHDNEGRCKKITISDDPSPRGVRVTFSECTIKKENGYQVETHELYQDPLFRIELSNKKNKKLAEKTYNLLDNVKDTIFSMDFKDGKSVLDYAISIIYGEK